MDRIHKYAYINIQYIFKERERERERENASIMLGKNVGECFPYPKRKQNLYIYISVKSGDRIPVGARFSAPVQTGPGAHPASCTMGTRSFPGGRKQRGRDADPSPLLVPRSKNRVELYFYCP
jgi:hypothetical protein